MPDDRTPPTPATPGAGEHPSPDRLRRYLDETLAADDAEQVAEHLDGCATCVAVLDDLEPPVTLPAARPADLPVFDERRMRRAVRRTLLRTALNAVLLVVVGAIVVQLVVWLAWHPLLVDRGDRVPDSVIASIDLPVMTVPGAEPESITSNIGMIRRITEVDVQRAVGSEMAPLEGYTTRLGPLGMTTTGDSRVTPGGPLLRSGSVVPFEPDRLGDGTAVTVELSWFDTIPPEEADEVADVADDLALLWVGFQLPDAPVPQDVTWRLGYSACTSIPEFIEQQRTGGFGSSGGFRRFPPAQDAGSQHALTELRRATANLAGTGWLEDEPSTDIPAAEGPLADMEATASWLADNDPDVLTIVITGSTAAVAAAVAASDPDVADLLEVDFDRGAPEVCG